MSVVVVAALQMVSTGEVAANLAEARQLAEQAVAQGAQMLVLPESFALFAGGDVMALAQAEAEGGRLRRFLAELAVDLNVLVVGGTLPLPAADGRVRPCCHVYSRAGELLGVYQKTHLFDADVADSQQCYRESDQYAPGNSALVVDTEFGRLGVAVCYDLRFPEYFRVLQDQGAEIVAVPSAFTRRTGWAHWSPLMRARAIENQTLMIGANQGGMHSATRLCSGGSMVVDAWGTVLAEAGLGAGVVVAAFDAAAQQRIRQQMPVASHRRNLPR
ncbi:carbon-nitrogen hydrolase family protein [Spongiibacter taiwanensis]|uniref:carbon-nitrogen hydrolase family protein n=1 Tax=Spongiibacter taiwanensis TaxID=1748242 RepID=UPI0020365F96|nr:carbon-nitrogen hydrolase family protein [Spongiibacter taiwanensis]USA44317.1 carbon-nitrogen hydrolase family protein [Spongiibacter taiwanensis]